MPIVIIIVAIIVMLFTLVPAAALVCHVSPTDRSGTWAWRTVDGRKCWYQGRKKFPRDQLHWPRELRSATADPATIMIMVDEPDEPPAAPGHAPWIIYRPIHVVPAPAPPLGELTHGVSVTNMRPIPDTFEQRWKGAAR